MGKPLLWFWGNMTRGVPRQRDSMFFDEAWLQAVPAMPRGRVVEAPSDHWMHTRVPRFCNDAIDQWLSEEEEEDADEVATTYMLLLNLVTAFAAGCGIFVVAAMCYTIPSR